MKYWMTVRTKRYKPGQGIEWACTHTLRYGRQALSSYVVTDRAPFGYYCWYHKRPDGLFKVDVSVSADKNAVQHVTNLSDSNIRLEQTNDNNVKGG